jgi:hypothetical protein
MTPNGLRGAGAKKNREFRDPLESFLRQVVISLDTGRLTIPSVE